MAKTYNDMMMEALNFHHSTEHLQLMRECSELSLMEQYISDMQFIDEHGSEFKESGIDAGYFAEGVDAKDLQYLMEKSIFKKKSIMHKILQGLLKLFYGFKTFSGKISKAFDETTKDANDIVKALDKKVLTPDEMKKVTEVCNKAISKCPGFEPHSNQPFAAKLHVTPEDGTADKKLVAAMAAGLSNKTARAVVGLVSNAGPVGALPITSLRKAAVSLVSGDPGDIVAAATMLLSTWKDTSINGLEIPVIPKDIDRASDELKAVMDKVESVINNANTGIQVAGDVVKQISKGIDDKNSKENEGKAEKDKKIIVGDVTDTLSSELMSKANEIYKMINASIGASMRLYSDYSKYRKLMIAGLKPIVLGSGSSKKDDNEEKKEEPKKDNKEDEKKEEPKEEPKEDKKD